MIGTDATVKCQWCGMIHTQVCHLVKAIEYHANGAVKRVEFKTANDYPPMALGGQHFLPSSGYKFTG